MEPPYKLELNYVEKILVGVMIVLIFVLFLAIGAAIVANYTANNMCQILGYDYGERGITIFSEITCHMNDIGVPLEQLVQ